MQKFSGENHPRIAFSGFITLAFNGTWVFTYVNSMTRRYA